MSITRGVFAQSSEPEAHYKVLDNNPDRIGIWKCWLLRRGENRSTRRKTSRSKESKDDNQQQTQPTYDAESGPHWWEACVGGKCSTTAPSLLPCFVRSISVVTVHLSLNMSHICGGRHYVSICQANASSASLTYPTPPCSNTGVPPNRASYGV